MKFLVDRMGEIKLEGEGGTRPRTNDDYDRLGSPLGSAGRKYNVYIDTHFDCPCKRDPSVCKCKQKECDVGQDKAAFKAYVQSKVD